MSSRPSGLKAAARIEGPPCVSDSNNAPSHVRQTRAVPSKEVLTRRSPPESKTSVVSPRRGEFPTSPVSQLALPPGSKDPTPRAAGARRHRRQWQSMCRPGTAPPRSDGRGASSWPSVLPSVRATGTPRHRSPRSAAICRCGRTMLGNLCRFIVLERPWHGFAVAVPAVGDGMFVPYLGDTRLRRCYNLPAVVAKVGEDQAPRGRWQGRAERHGQNLVECLQRRRPRGPEDRVENTRFGRQRSQAE